MKSNVLQVINFCPLFDVYKMRVCCIAQKKIMDVIMGVRKFIDMDKTEDE